MSINVNAAAGMSTSDAEAIAALHTQLSGLGIEPLDKSIPGELSISKLRRDKRLAEDDRTGLATLVEVDGVWFWSDGIVSRGIADRRAAGRRGLFRGGRPLTTVKFEKLGYNQIASHLSKADQETFTPRAGLREFKNGQLVEGALPVEKGRILLFIHGTFSNSDALINDLKGNDKAPFNEGLQFLADLEKESNGRRVNYDQILAFDHYTVSLPPILNALDLARKMASSKADVDIVCHSRGGLVTRWFLEVFDHVDRSRRRAIFVGSPLGGTSLAAPDRLRAAIDLFTNIGKTAGEGLKLIPFTQAAGCLMQVIFSLGNIANKAPIVDAAVSMIPGLAAMSRVANCAEINALKQAATNAPQYFAITGTFKSADVGWKFWKVFCDFEQRLAEGADKIIFRDANGSPCPNDLVVDTVSMTEYGFPSNPTIRHFGEADHVHHTSYFTRPETVDFIRTSFGIQ